MTVFHKEENYLLAQRLHDDISSFESPERWTFSAWDNREENIGYGPACNRLARDGSAPFIGLLNPDCLVQGPFIDRVLGGFTDPNVVITGERFGKAANELKVWGVKNWVCGAVFFVRRDWWEEVGGFDEAYKWGWEETDLCRYAESQGRQVHSISLPIKHSSPTTERPEDVVFKRHWFKAGHDYFYAKWNRKRRATLLGNQNGGGVRAV